MEAGFMSLVVMLISLVVLIISITKFKVHPLFALIVVAILAGFAFGIPADQVIPVVMGGFGGTIGNIGIVIVLGYTIGVFLEETGGALVLANSILKLVGKSRSPLAIALSGYLVSIPVFSDSAIVLLNPVARSLSARSGVPIVALAGALNAGIMATHTIVPPTPGPLVAAGTLGADLGILFALGLIPCLAYTLAGMWWSTSKHVAGKYPEPAVVEGLDEVMGDDFTIKSEQKLPSTALTFACILVPVLLICFNSFGRMLMADDAAILPFLGIIGHPIIALGVGVIICFFLDTSRLNKEQIAKWFGKAVDGSGFIVLATGAAGSYGMILRESGVGEYLGNLIAQTPLPAIFVPFLVACLLVISNGSATVTLATGSAIILPLMDYFGFGPVIACLALSSGASFAYHTNASHYWVVVKANNFTEKMGFSVVTGGTAVGSVAAFIVVWIMSIFLTV